MKFTPYSFSKLSTHIQCNKKFKYKYIDKVQPEECDRTALVKGGAVHSILENYPEKSTHKRAAQYQCIADKFTSSELGKKYMCTPSTREYRFGLTEDLSACGFSDKKCMFRGAIDYIGNIDNVLNLCDWKTGRYKEQKWQNYNQLLFYAVYFFQMYQKIDKIRISYIYVEHDTENDIILERKYFENYKKELLGTINNTENDTLFKRTESKLCDYCEFQQHCSKDL